MLYASLILPVPLNQTFTYVIPDALEGKAQVGQRVWVSFGQNHYYTGIIVALTPHQPETNYELKPILQLLDDGPIIRHPQYPLWQWMAQYYMCAIGDVMKAALPSELKPEESKTGLVREDFKPKTRTMVRIELREGLEAAFQSLQRSNQQQTLFMRLLDMSHALQKEVADAVPKDALLKASGVSTQTFNEVRKKGLLSTYEAEVSRLDTGGEPYQAEPCQPPHELSEAQRTAYREICQALRDHQVCLLHGVTSSGKTEIYIHLIKEILSQGRQVLMMVPEIALTTQLCLRLRRVFGRKMLVYHSKLSDPERVEIWKSLLKQTKEGEESGQLILGVRSSIFLPFKQL